MNTFIIAGLLTATGTLLITLSILGLRKKPGQNYAEPDLLICEAPSPDDSLRCSQEIGHFGWHRNGQTTWYGDSWNCDHWAETQEAFAADPEPTMSAEEWPRPTAAASTTEKPKAKKLKPDHKKEPRELVLISGGYIPPTYLELSQQRVVEKLFEKSTFSTNGCGETVKQI